MRSGHALSTLTMQAFISGKISGQGGHIFGAWCLHVCRKNNLAFDFPGLSTTEGR